MKKTYIKPSCEMKNANPHPVGALIAFLGNFARAMKSASLGGNDEREKQKTLAPVVND
jgi:hypothetical protein